MTESSFPECDQFQDHRRKICRGERPDLPLEGPQGINAYRRLWGLAPIGEEGQGPRVKSQGQEELSSSAIDPQPSAVAASPPGPSLIIRGWNFAQAITRWTLAGMPRRTQAEIDERLQICQVCPFLQDNHCTKCGCACVEENRLINKLALATEKCPEGKWA